MTHTKPKKPRLVRLVREIAQDHPDGLKHAEFVTEVLTSGYVHEGDGPLSIHVKKAINRLVTEGFLQLKADEDSREYQIAVA